jgi:hypothetical protein
VHGQDLLGVQIAPNHDTTKPTEGEEKRGERGLFIENSHSNANLRWALIRIEPKQTEMNDQQKTEAQFLI